MKKERSLQRRSQRTGDLINYPFEKGHLALVFLVSMHSDDIILGRNVVLHANSVKLFVLHRQSPSRLRSEKMEAVGLRTGMTLL
ncbi:hypothetical protein NC652_011563 [Populus alba x Populus x berolinensis]|nr:hypothetical protein NC652_011563 [Populus alba x Populus x berolinensis]